MRNKFKRSLLACCLLVSAAAQAESTAEDLSRIEAETLLLKARQKQLEVQVQIVTKRGEIATKQAENDRLIRNPAIGDPQVRSIEGIGRTVYASVELAGGGSIDVKAGDRLPNGMKIISIGANEVIVEAEKKRLVRLSSGIAAATPANPAYQNAAVGLPPFAPMMSSRGAAK